MDVQVENEPPEDVQVVNESSEETNGHFSFLGLLSVSQIYLKH